MKAARISRRVGNFISLGLLLCGLGPLTIGVFHTGSLVLTVYALLLLAVCNCWHAAPQWWQRLRGWLAAGLISGAVLGAIASALMIRAAWYNPPREPATVVVLGCQVVDDRPSLMLEYRLQAALDYLNAHPQSPVVCSGGYKGGGAYSEAAVMANWLRAHDIAPARIWLEERSTNTSENLYYTAQIIQRNALPQQLAIATDSFHQLRAAIYAHRNGLHAGALPAVTPWGLFPGYWVREWFGLVKALFL